MGRGARIGIAVGATLVVLCAALLLSLMARQRAARQARMEAIDFELKQREVAARAARARAREAPATDSSLAIRLSRLVADPDAAKPLSVGTDGELEIRVYAIREFDRAELHRVKGHAEAWSWLLVGAHGVSAADFGPPGGVVDLMPPGPSTIGGFPTRGLLHRVRLGPLAGAVVVYSPPLFTKASFQVGTVAYHQRAGSLLMEALCGRGAVPGVPADSSIRFKDECLAGVARRLGRKVEQLFPSPWMMRPSADRDCNLVLSGPAARGMRFECRWSARTTKTTVRVQRGSRR